MGADIHSYAEVRQSSNSKWLPAINNMPCDRNYWAFAVLADVRNGIGFAGIKTGSPVTPIAPPRGLPDDRAEIAGDLGDHSYSWVTLAELRSVDLDQQVTLCADDATRPLRDIAPLLLELLDELEWVREFNKVGPDDVRLVFGFDS